MTKTKMEVSVKIFERGSNEALVFSSGLAGFLERIKTVAEEETYLIRDGQRKADVIETIIADKHGYAFSLTFKTQLQKFATENKYVIDERPHQHEWFLAPVDVFGGVAQLSTDRPTIRIVNITSDSEFDILEQDKTVVYFFGTWDNGAVLALEEMKTLPAHTVLVAQRLSDAALALMEWADTSLEISAKGFVETT